MTASVRRPLKAIDLWIIKSVVALMAPKRREASSSGRRRRSASRFAVPGALFLALSLSGCLSSGGEPPVPLAHVDMSRMYGGWYLIATRKNGFEKGLVGPYDVYSKRPDGDIREDFYVRNGSFQAPLKHFTIHDWVRPGTNNAHWRVQVLWPINLPFLVLYTDPDYRYVLFGEDNRKLGWIYARAPIVPEADYQELHRLVVAEAGRFPALGANLFARGPQRGLAQLSVEPGIFCESGLLACEDSFLAALTLRSLAKAGQYEARLWAAGLAPTKDEIDKHSRRTVTLFLRLFGRTPA